MKDIKDILFTVHARLNSTRVPKKMIRSFSGKSLIEIAIEKLLSINKIPKENILLIFHEKELFEITKKYNLKYFKRSYESANHEHDIKILCEWYNKVNFKYFIDICPCSPLLEKDTINKFINKFLEMDHKGMITVIPKKNYYFNSDGILITKCEGAANTKYVKPLLEMNPSIQAGLIEDIGNDIYTGSYKSKNDPVLFEIEDLEGFDIDYEWQFLMAEKYYDIYKK